MIKILKKISIMLGKQYTSIGGQAVIEGVMIRSPNAFVVAVRKPGGGIRLRRDQWYGISQKYTIFKNIIFIYFRFLIRPDFWRHIFKMIRNYHT